MGPGGAEGAPAACGMRSAGLAIFAQMTHEDEGADDDTTAPHVAFPGSGHLAGAYDTLRTTDLPYDLV